MTDHSLNASSTPALTASAPDRVQTLLRRRGRWHPAELLFLAALPASFWLFPNHTLLLSQIWIAAIFALSLDLLQGFGGMPSLGQAGYFGLGAYAAALLAMGGIDEPLIGLVLCLVLGAVAGLATGVLLARLTGIAFLMLTLSFGLILREIAVRWTPVTGGEDGLYGFYVTPLFGAFEFDLQGVTGYWYALGLAVLSLIAVRRLIASPYGIRLEAVRENPQRAAALGISVFRTRLVAVVLSSMLATMAGCLLTQTTAFVAVEVLGLERSVMALIIIALGGVRTIYGAFVGAVIFLAARDQLSAWDPVFWFFWLGITIVAIATFLPDGLVGRVRKLRGGRVEQ